MFRRRKTGPVTQLAIAGDDLVPAGGSARLTITLSGDEDPTIDRFVVYLRLLGWENKRAWRRPLAELPAAFGTHELTVDVPSDCVPACTRMTEYSFCVDLKRTVGRGQTAACDVDVVSDDLYWPEGPRAEGGIELHQEAWPLGARLTGRVPSPMTLEIGPALDRSVGLPGRNAAMRFLPLLTVEADGEFSVELPACAPPTLHDTNEIAIVWEVRSGDAWARFGVLDPEGRAGRRNGRPAELLSLLANLHGDRLF